MKYADWEELREEFGFTPQEEQEITQRAAQLVDDRKLTQQVAKVIAEIDSRQWGLVMPSQDHPMWQVYVAYGEAVVKVLKDGTSE